MEQKEASRRRLFYVYKIALVASVGGFLFGYDLVIISGALLFIDQSFELTTAMKGFAVSSAVLGAIAGPLIGLWFADRIGRRKTMMLAAVFFMISTIGCAFATSILNLCFWRFLGGIGIGLAMMSSPIYIAELSPPEMRGRLVNINQLSNVIGINLAVIVSYLLSFDENWRLMFGTQGVPVLFLIIGLLLIPESPRWLIQKGRASEALDILTRINGEAKAHEELKEIREKLKETTGSSGELLKPGIRKALFIAIVLMIFSQINGVNMMLLYAPTIMSAAGINVGSNAILSSIPVYLFIFVCTLLAFPLISRYSRRSLLIASVSMMAVGHVMMWAVLELEMPPLYTLIPMLTGTGAFTLGFAPLSWVIVSEIFPNKLRSKALAIVCFFLYAASFSIAQIFPAMMQWFSLKFNSHGGMYLLFALVCIVCAVFSWRMVPETKGLSLEKIGEFWLNKKPKKLNAHKRTLSV